MRQGSTSRRGPAAELARCAFAVAWLSGGACASACALGSETEWAPPPEGLAESYVVAVTRGPDLIALAAAPADQPIRARGFPAGAQVHLLAYRQTIETLGLTAGDLALGSSCERSCLLVRPEASWSRPVRDGEWTPSSVPEAVAQGLLPDFAARCSCVPLRFEVVRFEGLAPTIFMAPRDDGVLIGRHDGSLLHLGRDRQISRICGAVGDEFSTGYAARATSAVWLAGQRFGSVSLDQASPDAPCPFREAPTWPGADPVVELDGPADEAPFELYALSATGAFARFDGTSWSQLAVVGHDAGTPLYGQVRWIAPGSAAAVLQGHDVAIAVGGTAHVETVQVNVDTFGIETLGVSARFGLLLGVYHAGVMARSGDGWGPVGELRRANGAGMVIELDDRILSAWPRGVIGQIVGGTETCADAFSGGEGIHRRAVVLAPGELVMNVEPRAEDTDSSVVIARVDDGCLR
ncbi:MAG: hypothetical protein IT384_15965 [Deltaproteobacteria bacterium]|nr:hypothetical protein [Deltaproteobacteria bacterium]